MLKKIIDSGMIWVLLFGIGIAYLGWIELLSNKKSENKIITCINNYDFEKRDMLNQYCNKDEDTFECFDFIGNFYDYDSFIDSCVGRDNKTQVGKCIYGSKIDEIYGQLNVKLDIDGSYVDKFNRDMLEIKTIVRSCIN